MKTNIVRYPPSWLLLELKNSGGPFDLDASWPDPKASHPHALEVLPPEQGLTSSWPEDAVVWICPPSTRSVAHWMKKMAKHRRGMALVYSRTDTRWFHYHVWPAATSMLFFRGRLHFEALDGTGSGPAIGPHVLVAYGEASHERLLQFYFRHPYVGHLLVNPC